MRSGQSMFLCSHLAASSWRAPAVRLNSNRRNEQGCSYHCCCCGCCGFSAMLESLSQHGYGCCISCVALHIASYLEYAVVMSVAQVDDFKRLKSFRMNVFANVCMMPTCKMGSYFTNCAGHSATSSRSLVTLEHVQSCRTIQNTNTHLLDQTPTILQKVFTW